MFLRQCAEKSVALMEKENALITESTLSPNPAVLALVDQKLNLPRLEATAFRNTTETLSETQREFSCSL